MVILFNLFKILIEIMEFFVKNLFLEENCY